MLFHPGHCGLNIYLFFVLLYNIATQYKDFMPVCQVAAGAIAQTEQIHVSLDNEKQPRRYTRWTHNPKCEVLS